MELDEYKQLLVKARKELPESIKKTERFVVPKVRGHIEGNKTVLSNFMQIAEKLRRDPNHLLKYILKELASPGEFKKNLVIVGSKISAKRVNEKIEEYANKYVVCKECNRPDTKLLKHDRILSIKCSACGARYPVS
ncbi:translation initiation factor IF-2 subunit beta [Candidatus Woesearchaeota archaeon]|nr:translation initiation factor IF-2 subunit beta [Candidatus Woesearchaeota archaeon]